VDLIVSDMVMPEMGGEALVRALRDRGWSVPVILATGYAETVPSGELQELGVCAYLRKPLAPDVLADAIVSALR